MNLLFIILGILIGVLFTFFYLKPKTKAVKELDKETENKNKELKLTKDKLGKEIEKLIEENASLSAKREEITKNISDLKKQHKETADLLYEQQYTLLSERMDNAAQSMSENYHKAQEKAKKEYLDTLQECTLSFQKQISEKEAALKEINVQMDDLSSKVSAAVEAYRREEEMKEKEDFYRLQLSSTDIEEIKKLREVTPYLRDSEPLNKVIWKVYYEKPYTDLIGRVIGSGVHTGIYKITNIENHMCYVGQAADLASRWKQHIKRGVGADAPTRNKLYPAMLQYGVENFTFEVVEECERSMLNEREDYWQEYFKAKEFGYSIK